MRNGAGYYEDVDWSVADHPIRDVDFTAARIERLWYGKIGHAIPL
jgi:hypothetical protein